ncbi:Ig-like domain-containing protein [Anaerolentibacter hominis]|uniref:Ig-like domain-containing protein n=1 Tax=Anaerolentibacter hominis TaxID=3079009 RepID=UPI0031B863CE
MRSEKKCSLVIIGLFLAFLIVCTVQSKFFAVKPVTQGYFPRLNTNSVTLRVGETFRLKVLKLNKRATFTSGDFKVARVNRSGRIKAVRKGHTVITVKVGGSKLYCRVKVID